MSNTTIDEKKLAEAMEKLACHIEPPKQRAESDTDFQSASHAASGGSQADFITDDGRVLLTQMTTAGG